MQKIAIQAVKIVVQTHVLVDALADVQLVALENVLVLVKGVPVHVQHAQIIALPHVLYHVEVTVPLIVVQVARIPVLVQILDENTEILKWR